MILARHKQSNTELVSDNKNLLYYTTRNGSHHGRNDPINIIENEFSNKGTTVHSPTGGAEHLLDRTKSSKVAQAIDEVHKEHKRRKNSKSGGDENFSSLNRLPESTIDLNG